jgi:hypothetical protein
MSRSPFVWWVRTIGWMVRKLEDHPAAVAFGCGVIVGVVLYNVL